MSGSRFSIILLLLLMSCRPADMYDQKKAVAYESTPVFSDQRSARPPVDNTVAQDSDFNQPWRAAHLDNERNTAPFAIARPDLERGRERYEIYCTPCHGWTGEGNGMIVQRGYLQPPSFHDPVLKGKPLAHYVQVMTSGIGAMPSYAAQIPLRDRWLIAVYLRVLQSSRDVPVTSLGDEARGKLEEAQP
ncbi:MAG TPA: cytochrome c [Oligoflexus sp.]|uniref:c-type cytochrome n=1 Tax=Oligoflexus sp. TaxID=1971216 RepID=UPI002D7E7A9A|nr:cytochrome c [Oligoflexus sp.]HET9241293.1 cytochrome c [Oligoflexus sp.]